MLSRPRSATRPRSSSHAFIHHTRSLHSQGRRHGSERLHLEGSEASVELFVKLHDDLAGVRLT
jgi:hypothetical protein